MISSGINDLIGNEELVGVIFGGGDYRQKQRGKPACVLELADDSNNRKGKRQYTKEREEHLLGCCGRGPTVVLRKSPNQKMVNGWN
ncbi:hypothetical protein PPACK8108_LOCUS20740 [Phakopsora pachyrhizi]|uniref:Uncharacterized protein n=1 Tax=Phakopsora pachyrhizi TaxID=170000 RepID=A0AAV0BHG4_PHAPC|nr:hypothetical protein PPACK8108_LOCUS20740 [Phakopsora pachyrhizi]